MVRMKLDCMGFDPSRVFEKLQAFDGVLHVTNVYESMVFPGCVSPGKGQVVGWAVGLHKTDDRIEVDVQFLETVCYPPEHPWHYMVKNREKTADDGKYRLAIAGDKWADDFSIRVLTLGPAEK